MLLSGTRPLGVASHVPYRAPSSSRRASRGRHRRSSRRGLDARSDRPGLRRLLPQSRAAGHGETALFDLGQRPGDLALRPRQGARRAVRRGGLGQRRRSADGDAVALCLAREAARAGRDHRPLSRRRPARGARGRHLLSARRRGAGQSQGLRRDPEGVPEAEDHRPPQRLFPPQGRRGGDRRQDCGAEAGHPLGVARRAAGAAVRRPQSRQAEGRRRDQDRGRPVRLRLRREAAGAGLDAEVRLRMAASHLVRASPASHALFDDQSSRALCHADIDALCSALRDPREGG